MDSYAGSTGAWTRYPDHYPAALRGGPEPVEEWSGPVHVDRFPAPDAPCTVVLLHGAGGYGRMLTPFARLLDPGRAEVLAPDLPGYGLSRPRRAVSYGDWVACAVALTRAEHARTGRPVVLFGASMGGMLAYDVAAALGPDVVAGVVATCLLDPRDPRVRRAVARYPWLGPVAAPALRAARPFDALRVPIAWLADMGAMADTPALTALVRSDPLGGGNRVALRFLRTWLCGGPAVEPEAFTVCPVLLAHPAADRWTPPELSRRFLDRIAAPTEYVALPDAGHLPAEPAGVDALRTALRAFLDRTVGGTAHPGVT